LKGIGAYAGFTVVSCLILFGIIKMTMGLRVSAEEETEGLDQGKHGMHGYDVAAAIESHHAFAGGEGQQPAPSLGVPRPASY
jgi:hypothetical protein